MGAKYFVKNIINHDHTSTNCAITIDRGTISTVEKCQRAESEFESESESEQWYEYAIPGFIDIHTHGGDGAELMDNSVDALDKISEFYLHQGTTSFLSSTVTDFLPKTECVLETAREFIDTNRIKASEGKQASCLGIHMEGPWLSLGNIGAQNPECCIAPDQKSMTLVDNYKDIVKMITFSYHTPEAEKFLKFLTDRDIVPACGHDQTIDEQIIPGFANGIKVLTHIYCVSSGFQRRDGFKHLGSLEMALMTDGVKVEVIADGKHITKYFWDFICHNKSYDDILIISDSMRCAGLSEDPDKVYKLGDMNVIVDQGVAWLENKKFFAGSVATMYSNFCRLAKEWNVSLNDAVKMTSHNQSMLFHRPDLGQIEEGKTADIILLDSNLSICKTIKSGIEIM